MGQNHHAKTQHLPPAFLKGAGPPQQQGPGETHANQPQPLLLRAHLLPKPAAGPNYPPVRQPLGTKSPVGWYAEALEHNSSEMTFP